MRKVDSGDVFAILLISIPSLIYIIPWVLNPNPSLGVDHYGGGSILMNKTLQEVYLGYFPDWFIGVNFSLWPVKYIYWVVLKLLSFSSSNLFTVIKLSFLLPFFLSIVTSYLTIKKIYKKKLYGMLGSLLYVYAPYHMTWTNTEAIWSMGLFYAILPLAFYYFLEFTMDLNIENKISNTKLVLSSLSLSLVMFTHPQSFLFLTFPFLAIFSILYAFFTNANKQKKLSIMKPLILSFLPIIIAFLIGTLWWLPGLAQKDALTMPLQTIDVVKQKALPFASIITLQGRSWAFPTFKDFFYSKSEIAIAFSLAIIIWVAVVYGVKGAWQLLIRGHVRNGVICVAVVYGLKEGASRKIYWVPSAIITSFVFILLAMGPDSPIPLYTWFYDNIPFFSNIRTPDRWLSVIILSVSFVFPSGMEGFSKTFPKFKLIGYCLIAALILANSGTELNYTFKNFNLNPDIYQHYEFLSSEPDGTRILPVPPYQNSYKLVGTIEDERKNSFIVDPRLWNFMYGKKENFLGGSETLSVKEIGEFRSILNDWAKAYSVNLNLIADVYGIDYVWIDKMKEIQDPRLFYYADNSTIKSFETENYTLYKNKDPFPRIFILDENISELNAGWRVKEGNGTMELISSSNNSLKLQIRFSDENVREWRYVEYKEFVSMGALDEIYGEYSISGVVPQSIDLRLKFVDEKGLGYIWIKRLKISNGSFRIPVFWFQPVDKKGTRLDVKTIKLLKIGIIESSSDIKSEKEGSVELKNLTILKHQLINTTYQKIDSLQYNVRLPEINNHSKAILIFNYAYSPNFKLKLNNTVIDGYKILGFLNGFEIPLDSTQGTIEYKLGWRFYFSAAISLVTFIGCLGFLFYGKAQKKG